MALYAMPLAMRSPTAAQQVRGGTESQSTVDHDILHDIQQSIIPPEVASRRLTLTLLKPVTASDNLEQQSKGVDSFSGIDSETQLNQALQTWLGSASTHGMQQDSSVATSRGWIIVKADSSKSAFWQGSESSGSESKWFSKMETGTSDSRASVVTDATTFPSLFTPESALWHKGPSPTLAPLLVEDPFADIDGTSDLSDLQTCTRASTIFDDQASSILGSRRTSVHSTWHNDDLSMTRSVSASSTPVAVPSFEKSRATNFLKVDIEVEISTEIAFRSARSKSTFVDLLDRAAATKLFNMGDAFPQ